MTDSNCANDVAPPAYRPITDDRFRWLETFVTPGQQVRVTDPEDQPRLAGYFDAHHLNDLVEVALSADPDIELAFSLQPLADPRTNRLEYPGDPSLLTGLRWLSLFFVGWGNPDQAAADARAVLRDRGWPEPVVGRRVGGGVQLYYLTDLTVFDERLWLRAHQWFEDRYEDDLELPDYSEDREDLDTRPAATLVGLYDRPTSPGQPGTDVVEVPAELRTVPVQSLSELSHEYPYPEDDETWHGPAFSDSRQVTPPARLWAARADLWREFPAGGTEGPDWVEQAARLLADRGLLFNEGMPILAEWDRRRQLPTGVEELTFDLVDAMNDTWEDNPGVRALASKVGSTLGPCEQHLIHLPSPAGTAVVDPEVR